MPELPDTPHLPHSAPIDAYGKGGFRFADMSHRGSLLCLPDGIWAWPVTRPQEIDAQALARVLASAGKIDSLLIGTGNEVWIMPAPLRGLLREAGIGCDTMTTGPAIRTYNVMIGEKRRVAAALIAVP
ncbi:MAG TPA: MTH938/NDUFAF3 family protein [Xanthobacteraceae bacterium]|nr:MTH938/NDUFAF3 family protein [Xanthobacteraceae bacterium]